MFLFVGLPDLRAQAIDWRSAVQRHEMRDFHEFLTAHPWIANKLRENPSLANNERFLRENPELPQFLAAHPFVQSSFQADPNGTMSRVQRGDWLFRHNPTDYREMEDFQEFLTNHPWIAGKLRENPSRANDRDFLRDNHELPAFLNAHPYVQDQFRADPNGFMERAQEFAAGGAPEEAYRRSDSEYAALRVFMENHRWIANKLRENPSRANNGDFLRDNRELRDFLESHPYLREQFQHDPARTIDRAVRSREYH
jgi:hypothetical protein